jgi:uncharacterized protein YchJ
MSKKHKQIKPDDYFEQGPFQVASFGKTVYFQNNLTSEQHDGIIRRIDQDYDNQVAIINSLVKEIRELVNQCEPLKLLKYAHSRFIQSLFGIESEVQLSKEDVYIGRELEYIQSILASSMPIINLSSLQKDQSHIFFQISEKIQELYSIYENFVMYHVVHQTKDLLETDPDYISFLIDAQAANFHRGDRYAVHEIAHLKDLLTPHNEELFKLFNIQVEQLLSGLQNIQHSLSQGMMQSMNQLEQLIDLFEQKSLKLTSELDPRQEGMTIIENDVELRTIRDKFADNFLGYGLYDLDKLTGWTHSFLDKLSWSLGQCESFHTRDQFPGWPVIEMPIYTRPFIKIGGKHYCFDYYNVFDNIYRVIQKAITEIDPSYKDDWKDIQAKTTEDIVIQLFNNLLPGCIVYQSNYYPLGTSLKQFAENDILILYDNNLIIIEVKGGSYTYTSPMLDIQSHIKSLQTLIGKADSQTERTLNYLKSKETVKIYDEQRIEKGVIHHSDFDEITQMCISLDNFNEFAAKAEKLKFLKMKNDTISMALDDLRVYTDLFDSPSVFLHFLKQRKLATQSKVALNDELDHFGMYMAHNMYSITANNIDSDNVSWYGYREKIDTYFAHMIHENLELTKPKQEIPSKIEEIINYIDSTSKLQKRTSLSTFLLDLSDEARQWFCDAITNALTRQLETKRMTITSCFGEANYSLCCYQPSIPALEPQYIVDYALAAVLQNEEPSRLVIHLHYNIQNILQSLDFKLLTKADIPPDRISELSELADKYSESRIMSFKRQNGIKKMGRNDPCPCGSGKKFKKCHGK